MYVENANRDNQLCFVNLVFKTVHKRNRLLLRVGKDDNLLRSTWTEQVNHVIQAAYCIIVLVADLLAYLDLSLRKLVESTTSTDPKGNRTVVSRMSDATYKCDRVAVITNSRTKLGPLGGWKIGAN